MTTAKHVWYPAGMNDETDRPPVVPVDDERPFFTEQQERALDRCEEYDKAHPVDDEPRNPYPVNVGGLGSFIPRLRSMAWDEGFTAADSWWRSRLESDETALVDRTASRLRDIMGVDDLAGVRIEWDAVVGALMAPPASLLPVAEKPPCEDCGCDPAYICPACFDREYPATASPDERLREALTRANDDLIQIADYSPSEVADAIDSVRAAIKDALAADRGENTDA